MYKLEHGFKNGAIEIKSADFTPVMHEGGDFWRLHLDHCKYCMNRELGVYSHEQTPVRVESANGKTVIEYDKVVAEDGSVYEIGLTFFIEERDGALYFSAKIKNDADIRVNELQYPFFEFDSINGSFAEDTLYLPNGLGQRVPNVHAYVESNHTEYMAADYKNIWKCLNYPAPLSMPWYALQSGKYCLYMGSHIEKGKLHTFCVGCEPREAEKDELILTISSYPAAVKGEELTYGEYCVALTDDWRGGADIYKKFIESTWYTELPKKDSIRQLNGWQRIILKHQYGEIFHTYYDLPKIYKSGAKYGINMILLFAWWKEGMDNGYTNYEPDPALGGADALRDAIAEINSLGGKVVLYANGHLIDISMDYYKDEGWKYTMKDIDGNEYREHYRFSNNGTLLRYGNKSFSTGCYATEGWRDTLTAITNKHLSLGSNGTFFDQIGVCMRHCFDTTHEHGNRIDEDPQYRFEWVKKTRESLPGDDWFGTEWLADRITSFMDFTHGCGYGMKYDDDCYPYIFRYVFPRAAISNRLLHDEKAGYKKILNYALAADMIFDVSFYRGRADLMEDFPGYAEHVQYLISLRDKYREFFTDGAFDVVELILPKKVFATKHTLGGRSVISACNNSNETVTVAGREIAAGEVTVFEV